MVSAVRAAGVPVNNVRPLARLDQPARHAALRLRDAGRIQEARQDAWLSPDATMQRIAFAAAFARGALPVTKDVEDRLAAPAPDRPSPVDA